MCVCRFLRRKQLAAKYNITDFDPREHTQVGLAYSVIIQIHGFFIPLCFIRSGMSCQSYRLAAIRRTT